MYINKTLILNNKIKFPIVCNQKFYGVYIKSNDKYFFRRVRTLHSAYSRRVRSQFQQAPSFRRLRASMLLISWFNWTYLPKLCWSIKCKVLSNTSTTINFVWKSENTLWRRWTWSRNCVKVKAYQYLLFWDGERSERKASLSSLTRRLRCTKNLHLRDSLSRLLCTWKCWKDKREE